MIFAKILVGSDEDGKDGEEVLGFNWGNCINGML